MKPVGKSHTFRLTLPTEYYLKWDAICGSLTGSQKMISIIDMMERDGMIPGFPLNKPTTEKTIFDN